MNKAKNIDDIENALKYFDGPAQNFAYATKNGDIGLTIAGKFPIKYEGQGKFILDGKDIKKITNNTVRKLRGRIVFQKKQ